MTINSNDLSRVQYNNLPQGLKRQLEDNVVREALDLSKTIHLLDSTSLASLKKQVTIIDKNDSFSTFNIFEIQEIVVVILFCSESKDLLAFWKVSKLCKNLAEYELIDRLNNSMVTFDQLGLKKVSQIISFLGKEKCHLVIKLNLKKFEGVTNEDIKIISQYFPKVETLFLEKASITNDSASSFAMLTSLKVLSFSKCISIDDFSFFEHLRLKELTINCEDIEDASFLKYCPLLEYLRLATDNESDDFSPITDCKELKELNLTTSNVSDISFVVDLPKLETLILDECDIIRVFNLIGQCTFLKKLGLSSTFVEDINFIKKLSNLENLDLSNSEVKDFAPIGESQLLKKLNLWKTKGTDMSFLKNLLELKYIILPNGTVGEAL